MKSPNDIIKEHYTCVCHEAYKSRGKADPSCVLCSEGGEIEMIAEEYARQISIHFTNWQLSADCNFIAIDHDEWSHSLNGGSITTEELFNLYLQETSSLK